MRQSLIALLERKLEAASKVLVHTYRHDMVVIYLDLQKEIEIQKCYSQHEDK